MAQNLYIEKSSTQRQFYCKSSKIWTGNSNWVDKHCLKIWRQSEMMTSSRDVTKSHDQISRFFAFFRDFSTNIKDIHQKLSKQVRTVISYHPWKFQLNRSNTSKVMGWKHTFFSLFGILIQFNPIFLKSSILLQMTWFFHRMCKLIKIDDSQSLEMIGYNDAILLRNTSYCAI